jgi:hypothetical protein
MKRSIYNGANQVLVWLGPDEKIQAKAAFDMIYDFDKKL